MPDMMQNGIAWLNQQLDANCSQSVTYSRGAASTSVNAVLGKDKSDFKDQLGNVRVETSDADFLINVADLTIVSEPKQGDKIARVIGAKTYTYRVASLGGEPCWRYSDPYQTKYRIHTKLDGVSG